MDLIYGVNKDFNGVELIDDFLKRFKKCEAEHLVLKEKIMNHPRFKASQKKKREVTYFYVLEFMRNHRKMKLYVNE